MNELKHTNAFLSNILTNNPAFQNPARLSSLYSDFSAQRTSNPAGYTANIEAWRQALMTASRTGLEGGEDALVLKLRGEETRNKLQIRGIGKPMCLGLVVDECVKKREFFPLKEFLESNSSIYQKSSSAWLPNWRMPSAWEIAQWGLRQVGLQSGETGGKLADGDYVVVANVEEASSKVLSSIGKDKASSSFLVYSLETFTTAFASIFTDTELSRTDIRVLLTHLTRDMNAASISTSPITGEITAIKFSTAQAQRSGTSKEAPEITSTDITLASLFTLSQNLSFDVDRLQKRIDTLDVAARTAVKADQRQRALAALKSKKLAESTLQRRLESQSTVEGAIAGIEEAVGRVQVVKALEGAGKILKKLNEDVGGMERVEKVMDSIQEQTEEGEEIGKVIAEAGEGSAAYVDVDDEMEALEKEEEDKRRKEREHEERKQIEMLPNVPVGDLESTKTDATESAQRKAEEEAEKRLSKLSLEE